MSYSIDLRNIFAIQTLITFQFSVLPLCLSPKREYGLTNFTFTGVNYPGNSTLKHSPIALPKNGYHEDDQKVCRHLYPRWRANFLDDVHTERNFAVESKSK